MTPLTFVSYFAAGFIYGMHFMNRCWWFFSFIFLLGVLVVFQVLLGLLASSIPSSNTDFWILQILTGLAGIVLAASLSWVLYAPALFSLSDVGDPVHFIWLLLQLIVWTAIIATFEFLVVPYGSLLAVGLFVVWAYVCTQLNRRHNLVFRHPIHASIVYGWMTFYLIFNITLPWTVVAWLTSGSGSLGILIGLVGGLATTLILKLKLRPSIYYVNNNNCEQNVDFLHCTSPHLTSDGGGFYK